MYDLKSATCDLMDKFDGFMNTMVKEVVTSWDSLVSMDEESLRILKESNTLFQESKEYAVKYAEKIDEIDERIEKTRNEIGDLRILMERIEKKLDQKD